MGKRSSVTLQDPIPFTRVCVFTSSHCEEPMKVPGHNRSTNYVFATKRGCCEFLHINSAQFCELRPVPVSPVSTKCQNLVTDPLLVRSKMLK